MIDRMWRKGNIPLLLVRVQTCTATLEISTVISQNIQNQSTSNPSNTTLGHIPKRCRTISQGCLLNYVHSSIIHNSKKLETTKMPLNQRLDKEDVVHLYNGVLLSSKKQRHLEICMQMDSVRKKHPELGNSDQERQTW